MAKAPLRLRLAKAILGSHAKEFIPPLSAFDGGYGMDATGRLKSYNLKPEQLAANIGWCYAANRAIVDPTAAVELKLFRKLKDGTRTEIFDHELLDLLDAPNLAHTGEQMRNLHFTYMNFIGESYIYMRDYQGNDYFPTKGKLPAALEIFPAHLVSFKLGATYTTSTVKYNNEEYPLLAFIRDLNPDPELPYFGHSIVKAAALTIDTEDQMKNWNRGIFANSARPSVVFSVNNPNGVPMDDIAWKRLKEQFNDEATGTDNAYKPLVMENGTVVPYMMSSQDLDFMNSRAFSMKEILSMWRVSPGMLGQLESANRASLDVAFAIHAIFNVKPRIRQFVKQLNASLVSVYDPTLELDFENPVPEDVEAKLRTATQGVSKWWTIDEVREQYGDKPLPGGLGDQLYMPITNVPLANIADGSARPKSAVAATPANPAGDTAADATAPAHGSKPTPEGSQTGPQKSLHQKQVSSNDFPGLYDDLDIDMDNLGCIMLDTKTVTVTKHVQDGAADLIPPTADGEHQRGAVAEREAHVTLLFGLLENGNVWKDKVDTVLKGWSVPDVTIQDITAFDLKDSYAIVGLIKTTPELVDGHERLTLLPHIQTFSEYKPHLTLAYVQHDQAVADKWVAALQTQYKGITLATKGINYGDKPDDAEKSFKSLVGVKKKTLTPEQIAAARERQGEAKKAKYDRIAAEYEQRMVTVMAAQFNYQRDQILGHLDTSRIGKSFGPKVKGKQLTYTRKDWLTDLMDWVQAAGSFKAAIQPIIHATLMQAGQDAIQEVGMDPSQYDPFTPAIVEYFQNRSMKIAKDVTDETEKQLRAALSKGVVEGQSTYELRAIVEDVMGNASTTRADRIARYEVTQSQTYGDISAWSQSGLVSGKEWITAEDEKVCFGCRAMNGKIVNLSDNFYDQGDEIVIDRPGKATPYRLNLDYESIQGPGLHNGCRCNLLPVRS